MSAEDHGLTCADSPIDHHCGYSQRPDAEPDQGVTWRESSQRMSQQLQDIAHIHVKLVAPGGMTDGTCCECGRLWPCQTVHIANGWGNGENSCYATGWCSHALRPVERLYEEAREATS